MREPRDESEESSTLIPVTDPEGRTDLANARRFVFMHGDRLRYCHAWKRWLVWDGRRWAVDDDRAVQRLAKATADNIWGEALKWNDSNTLKHAAATASSRGITAMLALAESELPVSVDDLDSQPHLVNCASGTIDLRTGEMRPHRREDNLTKLSPVEFLKYAPAHAWERFLGDVFSGDTELIRFVQRWFGYCCTASVREHVLAVFHGDGSNGKSTLLEAVTSTLGPDYAAAAARDLLLEKRGDSHPTEVADLFGRRLVVSQETDGGRVLAESQVKS